MPAEAGESAGRARRVLSRAAATSEARATVTGAHGIEGWRVGNCEGGHDSPPEAAGDTIPAMGSTPARNSAPRAARLAALLLAVLGASPGAGCRSAETTVLANEAAVELPEDVLARISRSLVHLLQAPAREMRIVAAAREQWPDASLGCPQPGIVYTQAVTPGWRLAVAHGETLHAVHADAEAYRVLVCP